MRRTRRQSSVPARQGRLVLPASWVRQGWLVTTAQTARLVYKARLDRKARRGLKELKDPKARWVRWGFPALRVRMVKLVTQGLLAQQGLLAYRASLGLLD